MTKFRFAFHRLAVSAGLIALVMAVVAGPAAAEAIKLEFRPPQIAAPQVCVPRMSDTETIGLWEDWDGITLPDVAPALIKRDIKRLQQVDAQKWLPTIELMIQRLAERDPGYDGANALLAHIQALEAAGQFETLKSRQLVVQLAQDADGLSPRLKNALSRYFRDGIGVPRDAAMADRLLVAAGYSGNADALLDLSRMTLAGTPAPGWDVPVELAVTMAFGSLVGELNPTICDRTARIAREYHNGEIVQRDPQLAHDWFRFTADLGDANAAWKVVEYHMEAESFTKDNATLLKYLRQASDAGLPFAQIELGRLYETGSLVKRDLDKTLTLFRAAATSGLRPGLTRVALFLEEYADQYPGREEERIAALQALAELPDAPGWVFARLAQNVLATKGRWAGQDEALGLLEEAAARGDMDGTTRLALMLIGKRNTPQEFERAVDLLSRSVSVHGGVTPTKHLHAAFLCQAKDSPRLEEAAHWRTMEAATDSANIDLPARLLIQLSPDKDPLTIAVIQSQALYGRPTSLASWLKYLDFAPFATDEMRAFWMDYSGRYTEVLKALAKLEFELAENPKQRLAAFGLLRQEYQQSGASAALELARALLAYETGDAGGKDDVLALLREPAAAGDGAAIELIAGLETTAEDIRRVYQEYAQIIAANGNFDALVFAIPFVDDKTRELYMSRAVGVMPCDYKNVMAMARLAQQLGNRDQVIHWLNIAEHLLGGNSWAMTDLAQAKMQVLGMQAAEEARQLYLSAHELGDETAARGLFDLALQSSAPTYDPDEAVHLIKAAADARDIPVLKGYLGRYRKADDAVKLAIEARLHLPDVYLVAAQAGDIYSMRAYGQFLQENAKSAGDLARSTEWLRRAAEGGDTTAMAEYGQALAFGFGVQPDPDAALEWLRQAALGGSKKAGQIIALVNLSTNNGHSAGKGL